MSDYGPPQGYDPSQFQQYDDQFNPVRGEPDLTFDFSEAVEPKVSQAIPAGPYPICLVDYRFRFVGKDPNRQWTVLQWDLLIEGSNTEYEGTILQDDWFMPNRALQEDAKYRESLGVLQARLQVLNGAQPITTFKVVPAELLGTRAVVDVYQTRDKIPDQTDAQGKPMFYPPRNRIRRDWHPIQQTNPQQFQQVPGWNTSPPEQMFANPPSATMGSTNPTPNGPAEAPQSPSQPSYPPSAPPSHPVPEGQQVQASPVNSDAPVPNNSGPIVEPNYAEVPQTSPEVNPQESTEDFNFQL